jgi:hypothetical protein
VAYDANLARSALQDVSLLPQTALAARAAFAGGETAIASLSTVFNQLINRRNEE